MTGKRGADALNERKDKASANYVVGYDGSIAVNLDEHLASICTSNRANDMRAVTIEVACDAYAPYKVTEKALQALIDLCTDICKRNGIPALKWSTDKNERVNHLNGCNVTVHRDYSSKLCPGDYLYGKLGYVTDEVNKRLKQPTPKKDEDDDMVRYKTIEEMPKAYRAEAEELVALGFNGRGGKAGLDVTEDMLRTMIVNLRMCKALIASVPGVDKDALFEEFKRNLKISIE